jgi:hypothetical protein
MSYKKWNMVIAEHFFHPEMDGREVLLFIDDQVINELGKSIGQDLQGFISSVIQGPFSRRDESINLCQKAYSVYSDWRKKNAQYPPYIAYLALFVLVGSTDNENFSPIAYYPKLRKLLGEEEIQGQYPRFDQMGSLWRDLELWSKKDKNESLGRFTVRVRGHNRHVGIPQSQSILSANERRALPLLFHRGDLYPTNPPLNNELINILIKHGQDIFSRRTMRLLQGEEEYREFFEALIVLVRDDLIHWNGTIPSTALSKAEGKIKKSPKFSFRIFSNNTFPEEPLKLTATGVKGTFNCKGSLQNWSTVLQDENNKMLEITTIDLSRSWIFEDKDNKWSSKLVGKHVRVFTRGQRLGLNNYYVEIPQLQRGAQFALLCHSYVVEKITKWGKEACDDFGPIPNSALPKGWFLFQGINPKVSCNGIAELTFSSQVQVRLSGGIRLGNSNRFLDVILPTAILENTDHSETLKINDRLLKYNAELDCWTLPSGLPLKEPLVLQVDGELDEMRKVTFQLVKPAIRIKNKSMYLEQVRYATGNTETLLIGPNVYNRPDYVIEHYSLPTFLSNEIIFIGRQIGQVIHWVRNSEREYFLWKPVWAIAKEGRNSWKLHYCSSDSITRSKPLAQTGNFNISQWKDAILLMLKVIEEPVFEFDSLYELWNQYVEVAKNA